MAEDARILVRHQAAIAGTVTDSQLGKPMAGVVVTLVDGPAAFTEWLALYRRQFGDRWQRMSERPDRTRTADDGHYYFLDLPAGQYTLVASWPTSTSRYGSVQAQATVVHDGENIQMVLADMLLPPTTLKGLVEGTDSDGDPQPITMAEVRMQGSGERAFTDEDGRYLLAGLETGMRSLTVAAPGYQSPVPPNVEFQQAGEEQVLNFLLQSA